MAKTEDKIDDMEGHTVVRTSYEDAAAVVGTANGSYSMSMTFSVRLVWFPFPELAAVVPFTGSSSSQS